MFNLDFQTASLLIILLLIFTLPATIKRIEENLEIFLFVMGVAAGLLTGKLLPPHHMELIIEALITPVTIHGLPIGIFQVVLIMGLIFHYLRHKFIDYFSKFLKPSKLPILLFTNCLVFGLISSIISVIVASMIISEILMLLKIERRFKVLYSVLACYALGIGAILTPVGEPLATIVFHKLSHPPYNITITWMVITLGPYVIPLVVLYSLITLIIFKLKLPEILKSGISFSTKEEIEERLKDVILRALKVYIFICALVFLGSSFTLLIEKYFKYLPVTLMYLIGSISAVVDNATLAAAFIDPSLTITQIKALLISMLISGGFLIPGNIPNIIVATRLKIRFKEWAKIGLIYGLPVFFIMFFIICIFKL